MPVSYTLILGALTVPPAAVTSRITLHLGGLLIALIAVPAFPAATSIAPL